MITVKTALNRAKKEYIKQSESRIAQLQFIVQEAKEAENIPDFMTIKMNGMRTSINFPRGASSCPFCHLVKKGKNLYDCKNCWYGKSHGDCEDFESTYNDILKTYNNLVEDITYYWTDDNTDDWVEHVQELKKLHGKGWEKYI